MISSKTKACLRDAGHKLSELRNSSALIGAVPDLRHQSNGPALKKWLTYARRLLDLQKGHLEEQATVRKLLPSLAAEQSAPYDPALAPKKGWL